MHAQTPDYDKTFFDDYSHLQPQADRMGGTNLRYIAPGALAKLAKYNAVMVDEPEVLISAQSDYKGAKPTDLQAMADAMRAGAITRLQAGGYKVVDKPGPDVLYVRAALTDVELTNKRRRLLQYTPAGAVLKFGTDMLKNVMQKYDIMNMVFQVELVGSESKEQIGQYVMIRGGSGAPAPHPLGNAEASANEQRGPMRSTAQPERRSLTQAQSSSRWSRQKAEVSASSMRHCPSRILHGVARPPQGGREGRPAAPPACSHSQACA